MKVRICNYINDPLYWQTKERGLKGNVETAFLGDVSFFSLYLCLDKGLTDSKSLYFNSNTSLSSNHWITCTGSSPFSAKIVSMVSAYNIRKQSTHVQLFR